MRIGVPKETVSDERRVALVPDVVGKLAGGDDGLEVVVESEAGAAALIPDALYEEAGATVADSPDDVWAAEIVVKVAPPTEEELGRLGDDSVLVGFLQPLTNADVVRGLARTGATAFALEAIPRISRAQSMDALSSQSNVAGYRAALIGAQEMGRFYPGLMTAAGSVRPATVLVLGAGVAGLQAIATAKRLGAEVVGFDVRPEVREQVQSLGASWLELVGVTDASGEGGYAKELGEDEQRRQRELLADAMEEVDVDVVITTALIPGRPAPLLVTEDAVRRLKPGGVVVDLAGEAGGNCELSEPGESVVRHDVKVIAPLNLPSSMAEHASQLYARNVQALLGLMLEDGRLHLDFDDEVIAGACIVRDGEIVNERARALVEEGEEDAAGEGAAEEAAGREGGG
jgi:NAD(P) transhydrogenase subunit alpha